MRTLAGFFALMFILLIAAGGAAFLIIPKMDGPGPLEAQKDLIIARGTGVSAIAKQLEKEGVIDSHMLFRLRHMLAGKPDLKAGEYLFQPHVSIRDAIGMMEAGEVVIRKVTVPEGWTSADIVALLKKESALTGDIAKIPAEGTLAPDTYRYVYGDTREGMLQMMQKEMTTAVETAWAQRTADTPLQSPEQMVALASIVEKETGLPAERPRIAGVYANRLKKGMLLQSDPTVIYGITLGLQPLGHALSYAELQKPTAYNTYTQPGLPPGPIANPGKASLLAAAKPEKNDYLFFVADGSGGHKFAATVEDHTKNVAQWRKVENGAVPPPPPQPVSAAVEPPPAPKKPAAPVVTVRGTATSSYDNEPAEAPSTAPTATPVAAPAPVPTPAAPEAKPATAVPSFTGR